MSDPTQSVLTEADWNVAQQRAKISGRVSLAIALVVAPALGLAAYIVTGVTASGAARYPVAAAWMFVVWLPLSYSIFHINLRRRLKSDHFVGGLIRQLGDAIAIADVEAGRLDVQARRQEFESRLANALDMAEGEPEVIEVIERSFSTTLPDAPVELLLADNSYAHLVRVASASPTGVPPGCGVDSPDHCPAARRAQNQRFADSEALDACPKLRGRPDGAISALCMPVSIMGRTVGVIHATGERYGAFSEAAEQDLETLAKLAGARIGLLRVMAETQLQAATDSLTGLANRRAFEQRITVMRRTEAIIAIALADLDHFKVLNDTYGHETGDRALRLFSQVLTESLRVDDPVSRHGGEEFLLAIPGCSSDAVCELLAALRVKLDAAITVAGLPRFTASFGVIESPRHEDLQRAIARADAALFQAKREGRDRVVVHDAFGNTSPPDATPHAASEPLARAIRRVDPTQSSVA